MYRTVVCRHSSRLLTKGQGTKDQSFIGFGVYAAATRHLSTCGGGGTRGGGGCGQPKERFQMPDKDMELKLASIQSQINEHYKQGDFTKSLEISKELLKQTESHFGKDHPATASAYNNIGLMQKLLGDFIEARKHYNQAMRIYGKVVGRDHASYAMTLHNLGALSKSQVHFDTSLKATERLSLVETALEHFEEAWTIRKAELGKEHPYTVATRSSYGSTLAAQVLYQHKYVERGTQQRQYVALNPKSVTDQGWKAAEEHLRQAMKTAIDNPRGRNISSSSRNNKKEPKQTKKRKGKRQQQPKIETLSAAAAAQNLAIFLKSRSMTESPYNKALMKEAKTLYNQVEKVREQLLPSQHPDLYATKYSMAELLDAIGDEEAANKVRQEIIDTYDPPPSEEEEEEETSTSSLKEFDTLSTQSRVAVEHITK